MQHFWIAGFFLRLIALKRCYKKSTSNKLRACVCSEKSNSFTTWVMIIMLHYRNRVSLLSITDEKKRRFAHQFTGTKSSVFIRQPQFWDPQNNAMIATIYLLVIIMLVRYLLYAWLVIKMRTCT